MTHTWVFLACNDHRNGAHQGWTEAAHIGGGGGAPDLCSLEGPRINCALVPGAQVRHIVVDRRAYPVGGVWNWVGNWCWDGYLLAVADAARLLQQLRAAGYGPDTAPAGFWGVWEGRRPITPATVLRYGGAAVARPTAKARRAG